MRVDGLVFASATLMQAVPGDQSLQQVANVAYLPGIMGHSIAMLDIHWGYRFPLVAWPLLTSTRASFRLEVLVTISIEACGCWAQV
jgi:tRNA-splicing ligase RtcB